MLSCTYGRCGFVILLFSSTFARVPITIARDWRLPSFCSFSFFPTFYNLCPSKVFDSPYVLYSIINNSLEWSITIHWTQLVRINCAFVTLHFNRWPKDAREKKEFRENESSGSMRRRPLQLVWWWLFYVLRISTTTVADLWPSSSFFILLLLYYTIFQN